MFDRALMGPNGCWIYDGAVNPNGYPARVMINRVLKAPYAWAWESRFGPIAPGHTVDHLCKTPRCFNPDHLKAGPHRDNIENSEGPAAKNMRKTHCPNGHPYDGVNNRGDRFCRICVNARQRARQRGESNF